MNKQSANSEIGFPRFLKRRNMSARLAAVQKYCCFRRSSFPTVARQDLYNIEGEVQRTRRVVARIKYGSDCSRRVGRLHSTLIVSGCAKREKVSKTGNRWMSTRN